MVLSGIELTSRYKHFAFIPLLVLQWKPFNKGKPMTELFVTWISRYCFCLMYQQFGGGRDILHCDSKAEGRANDSRIYNESLSLLSETFIRWERTTYQSCARLVWTVITLRGVVISCNYLFCGRGWNDRWTISNMPPG